MYSVLLSIFPFSMLALFGIGLELFFLLIPHFARHGWRVVYMSLFELLEAGSRL